MSGSELVRLLDAADFAARKHSTQRRKDPERTPYINHPIGEATGPARGAGGRAGVTLPLRSPPPQAWRRSWRRRAA